MITLSDFAPQNGDDSTAGNLSSCPCYNFQRCTVCTYDPPDSPQQPPEDPAREESVPLNGTLPVIQNWKLVLLMIQEAFDKDTRVKLLLTSNGTPDTPATQWYLRRVVS
jgi:hypothetical protein